MSRVYSTGPVENATANAALSTWVKVLNNSNNNTVVANIRVFRLNGPKVEIGSAVLTIPPNSSDFEVFDIGDVVQYEVQIELDTHEEILVSVWGKDADGNLLAAQRFIQSELNILALANNPKSLPRTRLNRAPKSNVSAKRDALSRKKSGNG